MKGGKNVHVEGGKVPMQLQCRFASAGFDIELNCAVCEADI